MWGLNVFERVGSFVGLRNRDGWPFGSCRVRTLLVERCSLWDRFGHFSFVRVSSHLGLIFFLLSSQELTMLHNGLKSFFQTQARTHCFGARFGCTAKKKKVLCGVECVWANGMCLWFE